MKYLIYLLTGFLITTTVTVFAQKPVNWTKNQLMQPASLAKSIKASDKSITLISIGPGAVIPGSVEVGMLAEGNNLNKYKNLLSTLPKNKKIVVYCGCCPYEHCPNVRPAIDLLKKQKFTNFFLLDLPNNMKVDWIDKKYPTTNN